MYSLVAFEVLAYISWQISQCAGLKVKMLLTFECPASRKTWSVAVIFSFVVSQFWIYQIMELQKQPSTHDLSSSSQDSEDNWAVSGTCIKLAAPQKGQEYSESEAWIAKKVAIVIIMPKRQRIQLHRPRNVQGKTDLSFVIINFLVLASLRQSQVGAKREASY